MTVSLCHSLLLAACILHCLVSSLLHATTPEGLVCTRCAAVNSSSLAILWETSLTGQQVQQLTIILVTCAAVENEQEAESRLTSALRDNYIVSGLHPWTAYVCTVAIGNSTSPTHFISVCPTNSCVTLEDVFHNDSHHEGAAIGLSAVVATIILGLCFCALRYFKKQCRTNTTVTDILMDTYRAEQSLDEIDDIPSTLRVGDGAESKGSSVSSLESPVWSSECLMTVSSTEGESSSSLGSVSCDEDTPLFGPESVGERKERATVSLSGTIIEHPPRSPQPLQVRPTQLTLSFPLPRSSPEGQSLSSPSPTSTNSFPRRLSADSLT